MVFAKPLRDRVMRREITRSVRVWQAPRVKIGGRYALGPGAIEVTSLTEIDLEDVDDDLARQSGFADVDDLLATARHGRGERVFVVGFHYRASGTD